MQTTSLGVVCFDISRPEGQRGRELEEYMKKEVLDNTDIGPIGGR